MELRETILAATEQRIDGKINELRDLKTKVEELLKLYESKEQQKIRSLVKIYENMKPKDAARIFEELDMDVLLEVVNKMNERRISPILADMDPKRAQEVTKELFEQRKLPSPDDLEEAPEGEAPAAQPGT
jgi:flagellar motility protein MotE (MotC chaperone)